MYLQSEFIYGRSEEQDGSEKELAVPVLQRSGARLVPNDSRLRWFYTDHR